MANPKFLKIVILILICINLVTLTFIWVNRPPHIEFARPPREPGLFLKKALHLAPQQQEQFFRMRKQHHRQLMVFQERNRYLHRRFFDLLLEPNPDSVKMMRLADSIAINQKTLDTLTYQHFLSMKRILNKKQQKKFKEIFFKVFVTITSQPLPPPPDPELPPHPPAPPNPSD